MRRERGVLGQEEFTGLVKESRLADLARDLIAAMDAASPTTPTSPATKTTPQAHIEPGRRISLTHITRQGCSPRAQASEASSHITNWKAYELEGPNGPPGPMPADRGCRQWRLRRRR